MILASRYVHVGIGRRRPQVLRRDPAGCSRARTRDGRGERELLERFALASPPLPRLRSGLWSAPYDGCLKIGLRPDAGGDGRRRRQTLTGVVFFFFSPRRSPPSQCFRLPRPAGGWGTVLARYLGKDGKTKQDSDWHHPIAVRHHQLLVLSAYGVVHSSDQSMPALAYARVQCPCFDLPPSRDCTSS